MILQSLAEYYNRKAADPKSEMAPMGFEWKEIPYVIALARNGKAVSLSSTYEGEGRDRRAKRVMVPKGVKKTSGVASNLLWDNSEYVLGIVPEGKKAERVEKQHTAFIERLEELGGVQDAGLESIRKFLASSNKVEVLSKFPAWEELLEAGGNLSFSLVAEKGLILERPSIRELVAKNAQADDDAEPGFCLISGERQPIERLHTAIKGVRGAQTSGANIVSFQINSGYDSYLKIQGANAPVSKTAAFAYTTGLNHLLSRDSKQKISIGDATTVFWAKKETGLETGFLNVFDEPPKDNPDCGVKAVRSLLQAVESGALAKEEKGNTFFVLGLAPNASRISIRFWIIDTVAEMAGKIVQHFKDTEIVHGPRDRDTLSLFRLLVSTASLGKSENIPPNLAGDTMRAILEGLPYPRTLLQATVLRNRAEQSVTYARASLIKACINRKKRIKNSEIKEELTVSLDTSNSNIGYRLGRLFATLEKIQAEANPGINATIRDRFYGAASSTPVAVFSNLMRLKNHHLAKLDSPGRRVNFEKLIAEIMDALEDFPSHLSLPDQGRFSIGYYHQTQDFYTSKKDKNNNTPTEGESNND